MMDTARWSQIDELFHEALAHASPQRHQFLSERCGSDAAMRSEIESLLTAHEQASSILEFPLVRPHPRAIARAAPVVPQVEKVGPYRLIRLIGTGGMGVVYEAQQANPNRNVALKLMRSLPGGDELTARIFRREGEALARLQHPGIASIYESGETDDGWKYFAMELVDGRPLTEYANAHGLTIRERLALFVHICSAVHYAHQRGVIHRDLKPSNILVTGEGHPKILDFGLARITDPGTSLSQSIDEGTFKGTLSYASPEQMRGQGYDIDVRSDVYSLGVVLYELLTGQLPYELAGTSLLQAARLICETPPRPASQIDRQLRGDLDTILCETLEKDPDRRYGSAAAMGDDLDRYLHDQPILAHPPNAAYQLRKLFARHKLPCVLAAALAIVILASAVTTAWLALRFGEERNAARAAQNEAITARDSAEEFATFLQGLFEQADPRAAISKEPTVRQLLDDGYERVGRIQNPLVRARLMTVLGNVYAGIDSLPRANELFESALKLRRSQLGENHLDVAETLFCHARALTRQNRSDAADAAAAQGLAIRQNLLGEHHLLVADAWNERGSNRYYSHDYDSAALYFREALAIRRSLEKLPSPQLAELLSNLGLTLALSKKADEAEPMLREALAMCQSLGDPSAIMLAMESLAQLVWQHDTHESERLYADEVSLGRRSLRPGHPRMGWILTNYAYTVGHNQGHAKAEPIFREAVQIFRDSGPEIHRDLARGLKMLGQNLSNQGRYAEATMQLHEAVDIYTSLLGTNNPLTREASRVLTEVQQRSNSQPSNGVTTTQQESSPPASPE